MVIFPKKRRCEVTFIDQHILVVRGAKYHSHDHELQFIKKQLQSLHKKIDLFMAKSQERFDLLMARLDTVTTDIAGDYKTLLEAIQADSISEESFAKHEANIAKLEELGASVDNPVPPVEPPVE